MSEIKVNKITPRTGTTITLGDSGDSLSIASGVALTDFTSTGIDDNATSTALTINSSGNVGIGTTSPGGELHLYRNSASPARLLLQNTEDISYIYSDSGSLIFDTDGGHIFRNEVGSSEYMRIDSSGNVGIGTSSINSKLDVRGTGAITLNVGSTDGTSARLTLDATNGDASGGDFPLLLSDGSDLLIEANNSTSDAEIRFRNNGSDAMRIDANGNVGIGTTTPDLGFGGTYLEVANLSQTPSITIRSDRSGGGSLQFGDQDDNNPGYISYQHNNDRMVFRAGDNQQVYIDGAGCMMLGTFNRGSAGNGDLVVNGNIYLGGTGSANALNDYEEGTWTPSLGGTTTNPTTSYNHQVGRYTKIGRTVHIDFYIQLNSTGNSGGTGTLLINGFPFNVGSLNTHGKSGLCMYTQNFSTVGNGAPIGFFANQNSTQAYFRSPVSSYPSSSFHTSTLASDVGNNLIVAGTLTYQITS